MNPFNAVTMIFGWVFGIIIFAVIVVVGFRIWGLISKVTGNQTIAGFNLRGRTADQKYVIRYLIFGKGCSNAIWKMIYGLNDARFDQILTARVRDFNVFQMALMRLGLDVDQITEIDPVMTDNYAFGDSVLTKIGDDFVFRASHYQMSCLLFSSEQVYLYSVTFSLIDNDIKEHTEEYFYQDVTSVATFYNVTSLQYVSGCFGLDVRWIDVPRYHFWLAVPGDSFACAMRPENEPQIKAMTAKLREKKNA
jgi:hypothetical protein